MPDEGRECPACGAESDLSWRCDECGKPFDGEDESRDRRGYA